MSAPEFFFALELSDESTGGMLTALASSVLGHVGCSIDTVAELVAALQEAVARGTAGGRHACGVEFRAHAGTLEIAVARSSARIWTLSRRLPPID